MFWHKNKGLKLYEERDEHATKKELKQLHDMATFEWIDSTNLTVEEKVKIASLMFLTEKQDGSIQECTCEDGQKLRIYRKNWNYVAPQIHRKNITTTQQGEKNLYMKVQKAFYEMLKSMLLFYHKLRDDLEKDGFQMTHVLQTNKWMEIKWL